MYLCGGLVTLHRFIVMEQEIINDKKVVLWNANYTKAWVSNFMIFFSLKLLTPMLPLYMA